MVPSPATSLSPSAATAAAETAEQRRALARHRTMATGLLVAMIALFIATVRDPGLVGGWTPLVQAAAEAALIGGLADWFAVTALFRRPLGLPIPHTALIPRNKDRIGRRLGRFVTDNFLDPTLVGERLRSLRLAERAGGWLARPDNAHRAADRLVALLPALVAAAQDTTLRDQVRRLLSVRLRRYDAAPLAARLIGALPDAEIDRLLDRLAAAVRDLLAANETRIYERVAARNAWWMPRAMDRRMARALVQGAHEVLEELSLPGHPTRLELRAAVLAARDRLRHDPAALARLNAAKNRLLRDPQVQDLLGRLWDALREALQEDVGQEKGGRLRPALAEALQALGRRLEDDATLRAALDDRAERAVTAVLTPWRAEIGAFIADVVARWDAGDTARRLELEVGKDLQYIRINGTLVGALVGGLLHLLVHAR